MEPITEEKVEMLLAKFKRTGSLEESEKQLLEEYRNIERYRTRRGGIDFAQTEFNMHGGRLEEIALTRENQRQADQNPRRAY